MGASLHQVLVDDVVVIIGKAAASLASASRWALVTRVIA
jgi:hypothetical protein